MDKKSQGIKTKFIDLASFLLFVILSILFSYLFVLLIFKEKDVYKFYFLGLIKPWEIIFLHIINTPVDNCYTLFIKNKLKFVDSVDKWFKVV